MENHKSEFDRRGICVVVISFAEPAKLVHYQEHRRWPFTILADPKRVAYHAFALGRLSWYRVFSPATLKLYWDLRRNGMKQEAYVGDDIFQAGGDFLLDRSGKILYAHRSKEPADRPSVTALLREIDRATIEFC